MSESEEVERLRARAESAEAKLAEARSIAKQDILVTHCEAARRFFEIRALLAPSQGEVGGVCIAKIDASYRERDSHGTFWVESKKACGLPALKNGLCIKHQTKGNR